MNCVKKVRDFMDSYWIRRIIIYFVIISFLLPRGYSEYNSIYRMIHVALIWGSTFIIWIQFFTVYFRKKIFKHIEKEEIYILSYFVFLIIITLLLRGLAINGYQKLIAYPSIILFIIFNFKNNSKILLNCINNTILIIFFLNQILLRDEYHITFLGHVQIIAQIGVFGIFCSLLYYKMYKEQKIKTIITILLVLYTMVITDASSSLLSAIILVVFGFLFIINKYKLLTANYKTYVILGGLISVIVVIVSVVNNIVYKNTVKFLDFSGRSFVWREALSKVSDSPIYGYGIEGVLIDVFWNKTNNSNGFNYAHNQNIQNLLDGGIIAFVLFYLMLVGFLKNIKEISDFKYKALINSIWLCFTFIMIFESTTLYYYMYMYLAIIYSLPKVLNDKKLEKSNEGT